MTIILIVCILSAVGIIGYIIATPKVGEKFTEFYLLDLNGKAQHYPSEFIMKDNQVTGVKYGELPDTEGKSGEVILGIVNHEQQTVSYSVVVKIDGQKVSINYLGKSVSQLGPLDLQQGEKWEQVINFTPQYIGDNQKVEFLLFKDGTADPEDSLRLRINVRAAQ